MGIGRDYFRFMAEIVRTQRIPTTACLQVGRQNMEFDFETLLSIVNECALLEPIDGKNAIGSTHPLNALLDARERTSHPAARCVSDYEAFSALGFAQIDSIDIDAQEGCSVVWDLNRPGLGKTIEHQYDLVVDSGTLEHVFNIPNALENIVDTVKIGGYVFHCSPMNNYVDHGFYQFSPTFFFDYYTANGFEIIDAVIEEHALPSEGRPVFLRRYHRDGSSLHDFPYVSTLNGSMYAFWFVARKTVLSTGDRTPEQFVYAGKRLTHHPALADAGKLVVWGAGMAAQTIVSRRLDVTNIDFFVDTDPQKQGTTCLGLPVKPPEALLAQQDRVVLISSVRYENTIRLEISRRYGANVRRIVGMNELLTDFPRTNRYSAIA